MARTAIIAGLGPGFGEQFARKLCEEGYQIGLFARSEEYLQDFADELRNSGHQALAVPTDITDPAQVERGFERVREEFGSIDVLSNQASDFGSDSDSYLSPEKFELAWRTYAYGALLCSKEAVADMRESGGGTILFLGARPNTGDYAYEGGKSAARGLARTMARDLGPEGIHVAHIVLAGPILNPDVQEEGDDLNEDNFMDPSAVVEACWNLIQQDKTAWTTEVDLRPHVENQGIML